MKSYKDILIEHHIVQGRKPGRIIIAENDISDGGKFAIIESFAPGDTFSESDESFLMIFEMKHQDSSVDRLVTGFNSPGEMSINDSARIYDDDSHTLTFNEHVLALKKKLKVKVGTYESKGLLDNEGHSLIFSTSLFSGTWKIAFNRNFKDYEFLRIR